MTDITVNRFRMARGERLRRKIDEIARAKRRSVRILDVGGRPRYWSNVGLDRVERVILMNNEASEIRLDAEDLRFETMLGDARDLGAFRDSEFDLVHSNSVIEHVGGWEDMCRMADETFRVGAAGWIQTPAWEFPFEPHFRLPVMHWFSPPVRRAMLRLSPVYRGKDVRARRRHVDRINLVSRAEIEALYPQARIWVERLALLPKSYVAIW